MGDRPQELSIVHSDCVEFLDKEPDEKYDLIYIDPPFNTGRKQVSKRSPDVSYDDSFAELAYLHFMRLCVNASHRVLKRTGSIYVHLDYHSVFSVKPMMDTVFGNQNFLNHVVWAYDYGGRGKDRWPKKHDDILVYAKEVGQHVFNWDEIDRIPYMAPGLQKDPERAAAGKVPTDVWWMSIVGTQSKERDAGGHYPTQKPTALVKRAILASSPPGGLVLDFFAGSGTTGAAALEAGRSCVLVDSNPQAIEVMKCRFAEQPTSAP